jgi:hypothetical protein
MMLGDQIAKATTSPSDAVPIVGRIVAVYGRIEFPDGSNGYTTATATYDIRATIPGSGILVLKGQVPEIRSWEGTDIQINASVLVDKSVQGLMVGGVVRWYFAEPPSLGVCGPTPQQIQAAAAIARGGGGPAPNGGDTGLPGVDGPPSDQGGGSGGVGIK